MPHLRLAPQAVPCRAGSDYPGTMRASPVTARLYGCITRSVELLRLLLGEWPGRRLQPAKSPSGKLPSPPPVAPRPTPTAVHREIPPNTRMATLTGDPKPVFPFPSRSAPRPKNTLNPPLPKPGLLDSAAEGLLPLPRPFGAAEPSKPFSFTDFATKFSQSFQSFPDFQTC